MPWSVSSEKRNFKPLVICNIPFLGIPNANTGCFYDCHGNIVPRRFVSCIFLVLKPRLIGVRPEFEAARYSYQISYNNGWGSTLNLVSDTPAPLDFTLSIHARSGQTIVAPKMTIQPQAKLPIDMAALLKRLGADVTGDFSEGSVSLNFVGTIMPLVGQMTITNPALRLVHESEMVENDPGRTDIPAVLEGLWWNISGGRDAQIMVTNMSSLRASADVFLDFAGTRHPSVVLNFQPHELKTISIIQLLADLNAMPSQVPEGGIMIIQRDLQPTLIALGKVLDPATGFSTTLSFPDPARERSNSLHASGVPVGTPTQDSPFAGAGYFIPHVIVHNLIGAAQTVSITVEYPKGSAWNSAEAPGGSPVPTVHSLAAISGRRTPGSTSGASNPNAGGDTGATISPDDLTGQFTLAPVTVAPYSTLDYSLDSIMGQLPLPIPYCSIRIQYSGAAGSMVAQVSSVEMHSDMVIDAAVANEGDGWRGSGANPWHLDSETESIVFLTDSSDKPARIGFSVTAGGVHYYLTTLKLAPHETRAIDLRKLRDAQQADFQKNKIPMDATDGSVTWIRLDNVAVSGRLMVVQRHNRIASSYDCCIGSCPPSYTALGVSPGTNYMVIGTSAGFVATATYQDANGTNTYATVTPSSTWSSNNTPVATVDGSGTATGVSGGTATIDALYTDNVWYFNTYYNQCFSNSVQHGSSGTGNVQVPTFLKVISNTTQQQTCSPDGVRCARLLDYQVLDQNQNAIQIAGMTIREHYSVSSQTCGFIINDSSTWVTSVAGDMTPYADGIGICCPSGSNCFEDVYQTFDVNYYPVTIINGTSTGARNYIVLTCTGGAGSPCPTVTPTL
ncbi:MAG TPA: Ig-like domain-containing protein [Terriglobia bacterium]|nr:Ig-like domain-containing protein [Terriglobia bacterium]